MRYNVTVDYFGIDDQLYQGQYAKLYTLHNIDNENNDTIIYRQLSVYDSMGRLCYSKSFELKVKG